MQHSRDNFEYTRGITASTFDLLHAGHISYLEKAKNFGDILILGLNSDRSVNSLKGKGRPVNLQEDRAYILAALEVVDYVVIFDEDTPYETIKALKPSILVKGADWKKSDIAGADIVEAHGGKAKLIAKRSCRTSADGKDDQETR